MGLFILVFNAYLLLEVLFIGPQYNLYAVLGPMLLTLGLGVACWPLCIVCGTPVGLVPVSYTHLTLPTTMWV